MHVRSFSLLERFETSFFSPTARQTSTLIDRFETRAGEAFTEIAMKLRLARLKVERRRLGEGERGVKVMAVVGRGKMEDEKKQRDEGRRARDQ